MFQSSGGVVAGEHIALEGGYSRHRATISGHSDRLADVFAHSKACGLRLHIPEHPCHIFHRGQYFDHLATGLSWPTNIAIARC